MGSRSLVLKVGALDSNLGTGSWWTLGFLGSTFAEMSRGLWVAFHIY